MSTIQYALDSRSVDGAATYDSSSLKNVELVSADMYSDMALLPEFKEGQLSMKYDSEALKKRALSIYLKYDDPKAEELQPKPINVGVTDASDVA
ncbi:hypothetical protein ICJ85_01270 [Aestuariibaculum marinum]|uniref:Uncharacterized protein n=1 Tax=Aestuariibaculum marinum TaxID=2683592 RepID=A0A8J6PQL2_9FLAO|nr:hypothetical protein [Aestuariibaculum marinum]